LGKFSSLVENTGKKFAPSVQFVGIFVWHREIKTIAANFAIPNDGIEQMARKNDGAGATPKQI
jgi:hypothetical protein